MSKGKVCLAYSGGLDTSIILAWLLEQGYEVVAFMANVGQEEDFAAAEKKALAIGATKYVLCDVQEEFVSKILFPAVQVNAVYEDVYLLGTALARPIITKAQMDVAEKEGCQFVSHGCTGKGNDQIRFEQGFYAINPEIQIIAPWRLPEFCEKFKGRKDLIEYADSKGIPVAQTGAKPWSTDENMAHISYEAGILEDPDTTPPKDMWKLINDIDNTPNTPQFISIAFEKGLPTKLEVLDGQAGKVVETVTGDLNIFLTASKLGRLHGIGRIDIVENRYINLKSRGCYEQAPLTILRQAHVDLEGLTLDKEVRGIRDQFVTPTYSKLIYNGAYFSPECEFIRGMIKPSQVSVNGTVRLMLYKGKSVVLGRFSDSEILYNAIESSMDELTGFSPEDTTGFINIQAIRIKKYGLTKKNRGENVEL